jgi:xanthine dehydrogenase accessory factor
MRAVIAAWLGLLDRGERGAMATVVRASGSTPQGVGARLVLGADGTLVGTIGGGRIEQVVLELAREVIADGKARVLSKHLGRDLGMCCGGTMEVLVEPIEGRPPLILFGAGHVAQPLARLGHDVGFSVIVVDDRAEQNTEQRFPDVHQRILMEPAEAVRASVLPFGPDTFVVITTHDHRLDEEALRACLPKARRYLGMIGSRRKVHRIYDRIRARAPDADLSAVHSPIGLALGAETPSEIAVSIVAELIAVRRGGSGASMRLALSEASSSTDDDDIDIAAQRTRRI